MRKKLWIGLALMLVIPGLLFTASCAKKTVQSEASVSPIPKTETAPAEKPAAVQPPAEEMQKQQEAAKQQEMEQQSKLQEEQLKEKQAQEAKLAEERSKAEAEQKIEEGRRKAFLQELVLFDFDSSVLTPVDQDRLTRKAEYLKNHPKASVIIEGHCDERGSTEYNLALGWRRAEAAKAFLVDLGVPTNRMSTISYGKERPFAKGHNEAAWRLNRRAQFVLE